MKREDINKNVLCLNGYINVSSLKLILSFGVIINEKYEKKIGVIHLWDAIIQCVMLEIKLLKNSFEGI